MINFEKHMEKLSKVHGYLGAAVLNYTGETLYIENDNTGTDIGFSSAIFNDSFRMISESSLDVGFSEAASIEAKTQDGHVFLMKSAGEHGKDEYSKINIFCIFRDDGNIALAKMIIDKSSKNMAEELSNI